MDGKNIKVFRLNEEQLRWFKDKAEFCEDHGGDCEYVDELPPRRGDEKVEEIKEVFDTVGQVLRFKGDEKEELGLVVKRVIKLTDWPSRWRTLLGQISTEIPTADRREAFSDLLDREQCDAMRA
jgi:hypothetical protein